MLAVDDGLEGFPDAITAVFAEAAEDALTAFEALKAKLGRPVRTRRIRPQ